MARYVSFNSLIHSINTLGSEFTFRCGRLVVIHRVHHYFEKIVDLSFDLLNNVLIALVHLLLEIYLLSP